MPSPSCTATTIRTTSPPSSSGSRPRSTCIRLWTIHPKYLDSKGLTALWREGLLALAVLKGRTVGYRHHPQLHRFRKQAQPVSSVRCYLTTVLEEAEARGYRFDASKIRGRRAATTISESSGQLLYEWNHLRQKLRKRNPQLYRTLKDVRVPRAHPLFHIAPGPVREWEKGEPGKGSDSFPRRPRRSGKKGL